MGKTLVDLLQEDMILLDVTASDWKEALRIGVDLLEGSGGVEPRYYDEIIKMIDELGPYVVIAPGLALGHAGPDAGVIRTCFSLITLAEPVEFGVPCNDPVDIVFCFAAPNKEDHMAALRQMALFCCEPEHLELIRKAKTAGEIREKLIGFFEK
jgi:mannitol/fructose-specific phosphotransferase system IIA component (Ntr-type)